MNNKIEPGTLCMIKSGDDAGACVTAVRFLRWGDLMPESGPGDTWGGNPAWLVSAAWIAEKHGHRHPLALKNLGPIEARRLMPLHPPAEEPSQCARQSKLTPV